MKNKFNIVEGFVPATPRSQRKKNAVSGGGSTIVVEGSGEGNSSLDPNSHTHTNLPLLESLADQDGYLTRKEENPDTGENADPFVYTKVKAGFADKAGDSEKWNGKAFADYLDQPVRKADAVEHKSVTVSESVTSKDFIPGDFSGSGFGFYFDANGNAVAEVDIIKARKEAVFNTAVINQVTFQVGATVFSNGGCEITRVEDLDDVYRCYYDTKEGRRFCGLVVDDQVRCQRYDATQNTIIKYYWRLVVAVGDDYVDLSKTDVDGTGVPEEGDEIAQFGHRTDKTRQGATIIDPKDGSSVVVYSEINSYSLVKKNFVGLGTNPQTGRPYLFCYGDLFIGDRELKDQFLTYQIKEGQSIPQLFAQMNIMLGAGSSGLTNLTEWPEKQQQIDNAKKTAIDAQDTANTAQQTAEDAARKAQEAKDYINSTLPEELAEIHRKIDGVVEGWYYPYTPTLENEPAASWIRDGEQDKHRDDTFTNIQEYVDYETTPDAGKSWRWMHDGSTWKWTPIADSDAVRALLLAAKAQDTADGKRRTFVVQPTTPYDVGDIWSQGSNGDLMRCIKSRASGAFDASDWDKASKYTDDTVALEAKQAAQTAQQTANTARDEAQKVKEQQEIFASDSYISPMEKTSLKQQQADIKAEYAQIVAEAQKYNITQTASGEFENTPAYWESGSANMTTTGSTWEAMKTTSTKSIRTKMLLTANNGAKLSVNSGYLVRALIFITGGLYRTYTSASQSVTVSDTYVESISLLISKSDGSDITVDDLAAAGLTASDDVVPTQTPTVDPLTAYTSAYTAADAALTKYTAASPSDIPIEADYDNIAAYYTARQTILDAIAAAAKKYVDDVEVGSVNLVKRGGYGIVESSSYLVKKIELYKNLTVGNKYTIILSGQLRGSQAFLLFDDSGYRNQGVISPIKDRIYSLTFTFTPFESAALNKLDLYNYPSSSAASNPCDVDWVCLYEGDVKAPYTFVESIYDIKEDIGNVQQAVSDLDYLKEVFPDAMLDVNGVVLAQLLGVKNSTAADAAVVAGFYGGSDETLNAAGFKDPTHGILMMFAGASNIQSVASAKTRIYGDGHLVSASADITGKITATSGVIGGFTINQSYMQAGATPSHPTEGMYLGSDFIRFNKFDSSYSSSEAEIYTYLGSAVFPSTAGGSVVGPMVVVNHTKYSYNNVLGIYIDVDGRDNSLAIDSNSSWGCHALYIPHGDICGLRFRTRRVSSNTTLTTMDSVILCISGSSAYTLTLPSDPDDGQIIITKSIGGSYTLKVGASGQYINSGRVNQATSWQIGIDSVIVILIWDKVNNTWQGGFTNTK